MAVESLTGELEWIASQQPVMFCFAYGRKARQYTGTVPLFQFQFTFSVADQLVRLFLPSLFTFLVTRFTALRNFVFILYALALYMAWLKLTLLSYWLYVRICRNLV